MPVRQLNLTLSLSHFYLSNRPQVSMVYRLIGTRDVDRILEKFVNHEPQARNLWSNAFI